MQSKRMVAVCSAIAVLCFSSDARASEGQLTRVYSAQTSMPSAGAEGIQKFTVGTFDEKLGKLRAVSVEVGMKVNGRWQVENLAPFERKLDVGGAARLTLTAFGDTELFAMTGASSQYLVLGPIGSPLGSVFGSTDPSGTVGMISAHDSESFKFDGEQKWTKNANPDGVPMHLVLTGRVSHDARLDSDLRAVGQMVLRVTYHFDYETPPDVEKDDDKLTFDSARARREDALLA